MLTSDRMLMLVKRHEFLIRALHRHFIHKARTARFAWLVKNGPLGSGAVTDSYQRVCHTNEAGGSLCLTVRLLAAFACLLKGYLTAGSTVIHGINSYYTSGYGETKTLCRCKTRTSPHATDLIGVVRFHGGFY